MSEAGVQTRK